MDLLPARGALFGCLAICAIACGDGGDAKRPQVAPTVAPRAELEPAAYCDKLARLVAAADGGAGVKMPCAYFTPLYVSMRRDNAASYACSARCANDSADFDAFNVCDARARCAEQVAAPEPRAPGSDEPLESYCRRMTSYDDEAKPRLGMWACAFIGGVMKRETPRMFDCSLECATASSSMGEYHECLHAKACGERK